MKLITFADKTLLVDDEVADLLLAYAAALANAGRADTVNVSAIGADGESIIATLLLDAGATLMAETTNSTLLVPKNSEALEYMRNALAQLTTPPRSLPDTERHQPYGSADYSSEGNYP